MKIVNLTPHVLRVETETEGYFIVTPPSGQLARVGVVMSPLTAISVEGGDVPLARSITGEVVGLPAPEEGVIFVTSLLAAQAARREDVLSPGELIRGEDGQPIGCRGLSRPW